MTQETHPCDYAFPVAPGDVPYWQPGMTLRDWFAGQALSGFASTMGDVLEPKWGVMAQEAYEVADAMLAARAEGGDA